MTFSEQWAFSSNGIQISGIGKLNKISYVIINTTEEAATTFFILIFLVQGISMIEKTAIAPVTREL